MFKSIETHEKFYKVVYHDGSQRIVRRDVYWDSGFKSQNELDLMDQIHAQLEQHHIPCMEIK
jgi:hypothetical protein